MFIILDFAEPKLMESAEGGKNASTDPRGEFSFSSARVQDNFDLQWLGGRIEQLFLQAFTEIREEGVTSTHEDIGAHFFADVDVAFRNGVKDHLVEAGEAGLLLDRVEEAFHKGELLLT